MAKPLFPGYTPEQIAVLNKLIPGGTGVQLNRNSFTPYQPPPIPSGYYDPALDAQRQAASRGLLQGEQDIGLAGRRGYEDYGYETGQIEQGYGRGLQDLNTSYGRNLADLTTSRDRGNEDLGYARSDEGVDYGRNVQMLARNYGQLGRRQAEQQRKYGINSGGIALLSASKRQENQALEQRDIDTAHQRAVRGFDVTGRRIGEDYTTGSTRLGEDLATGTSRLGEDRAGALDRTGTLYNRGVADRGTALSRARSEDLFYGLDVNQQKLYQAQQAGYSAPGGPANEFTKPNGTVYRVVKRGGYRYEYDRNGKVLSKKKA